MGILSDLARGALDLIFPLHCLGCRREGSVICGDCTSGLKRLEQPFCPTCAQPRTSGRCRWCRGKPPAFDSLRAPFLFEGVVREGIHRLKYRGLRAAGEPLGQLLTEYFQGTPIPADMVVPVPLHPGRLRRRGYNQSSLLARRLAGNLGLEFREDLVARVRDSVPQVETRSAEERRSNVAGAFAARAVPAGVKVLLIDDVATTGSTLSECAAALKSAGAESVRALVLARQG